MSAVSSCRPVNGALAWLGRVEPGWVAASAAVVLLVMAPIGGLIAIALQGSGDLWPHLVRYVIPRALIDTTLLLVGVATLVIFLGAGLAWLTTAYDFPGRRLLGWLLLLPLAMPTYIVAYAYSDLLQPSGGAMQALRAAGFSPAALRALDVRSLTGCILLFGLVLYPYVFLATRSVYLLQAANVIEVARTLGAGPVELMLKIALPLARPAVAVGASLALMEALNDIGAAEFLGVDTLTRSIYSTWTNRSNLPGAAQIALSLLAIVLGIVLVERWGRRQRAFALSTHGRALTPQRLTGLSAIAASVAACTPVLLGFAIPAAHLALLATERIASGEVSTTILGEIARTVTVAAVAAALAVACGLLIAYTRRLWQKPLAELLVPLASLGYAMPGTVIALGLVVLASNLDGGLARVSATLGLHSGQIVMGSLLLLCGACAIRFLAITAGGIDAGFAKLPPSIGDAARTLGESSAGTLLRVHLPLLRPAILAGGLLVFVDCMKELPITLMLRPLNFETLATHIYGEAARGAYEDGTVAALCIVIAGLAPVILLSRAHDQRTAL